MVISTGHIPTPSYSYTCSPSLAHYMGNSWKSEPDIRKYGFYDERLWDLLLSEIMEAFSL